MKILSQELPMTKLGATCYIIENDGIHKCQVVGIEQRLDRPTKYWYTNDARVGEWFFTDDMIHNKVFQYEDVAQHVLEKSLIKE